MRQYSLPYRVINGKHIFLVGFMGAGKTTIGAALQALTGMTLLDTDQQIAESGKESR